MKQLFVNTAGVLRSGWWVVVFFVLLVIILLPILVVAKQQGLPVNMGTQAGVVLATSLICQWLHNRRLKDVLGKMDRTWFSDLLSGLKYGLLIMLIPAFVLTCIGAVTFSANTISYYAFLSNGLLLLQAAFIEELLFRGFIFLRLIESFGSKTAQLLVAGLFLLVHIDNRGLQGITALLAGSNIFVASLLFGMARMKSGQIAMPLGMHFMANLAQGTLMGFGVSGHQQVSVFRPVLHSESAWLTGGMFGLEGSVTSLAFLLFVAYVFRLTAVKKRAVVPEL